MSDNDFTFSGSTMISTVNGDFLGLRKHELCPPGVYKIATETENPESLIDAITKCLGSDTPLRIHRLAIADEEYRSVEKLMPDGTWQGDLSVISSLDTEDKPNISTPYSQGFIPATIVLGPCSGIKSGKDSLVTIYIDETRSGGDVGEVTAYSCKIRSMSTADGTKDDSSAKGESWVGHQDGTYSYFDQNKNEYFVARMPVPEDGSWLSLMVKDTDSD